MASQFPFSPTFPLSSPFPSGSPVGAYQMQFPFYPPDSYIYPCQPSMLPPHFGFNPGAPPPGFNPGPPPPGFNPGPPPPPPQFPHQFPPPPGGGQYRGRNRLHGNNRGRGRSHDGNVHGHFECKVCSKEYKTEDNYKMHLASHQKCKSCDFSAHPRVLRDHEVVHLLPDMLKFSSKEDIQKWREERKKNYPTMDNVIQKKKLEEDKHARGETATTPLHRYIQQLVKDDNTRGGHRRGRGRGRGRGNFRRGRGRYGIVQRDDCVDQEHGRGEGNVEEGKGVKLEGMGSGDCEREDVCGGRADCVTGEKIEGGDDGAVCEGVVKAIMEDIAVQEGVSEGSGGVSLELGGGDGCTEQGVACVNLETSREKGEAGTEVGGDCGKEHETCISRGKERGRGMRMAKGGRKREKWVGRREAKRRKVKSMKLQDVSPQKPTLLEKLLAPEIRCEQNMMLQCIRHVVSTGFLGHYKSRESSYQEGGHPSREQTDKDEGQISSNQQGSKLS